MMNTAGGVDLHSIHLDTPAARRISTTGLIHDNTRYYSRRRRPRYRVSLVAGSIATLDVIGATAVAGFGALSFATGAAAAAAAGITACVFTVGC